MFKTTQRCMALLATLSSLENNEEYTDTLMELVINIKSLVERAIKDGTLSESCLLCCHQITTCLKFIQCPPVDASREVQNYFETRIRYCLTELQSRQEGDTPGVPDSVLTAMDLAVDLLESPDSDQRPSLELIDAIDRLLSQVLLFRTVVLAEDQTRVLEMCRVVLSKKLRLAESDTPPMKALVVGDLKIAVTELEQLLNDCVLRLFVSVMVALDDDPLSKECALNEGDFDLLMDRLIQLGIIAIGFTESGSVKLNLRSAVASLESLDLHLVPAVLLFKHQQQQQHTQQLRAPASISDDAVGVPGDTLRRTLVRHWREETAKLSINIHKIIDTKALAGCLIEWISEQLNRNEAQARSDSDEGDADQPKEKRQGLGVSGAGSLDGIRKMFLVFHHHLCLNSIGETSVVADAAVATTTGEDFLLRHHRKDIKIMLNECKAVLKYADQVETPRIFKRFRLLLHILEKIRRDLPSEEGTEHDNDDGVANKGDQQQKQQQRQNKDTSTSKAPKRDRTATHVEGLQHVSTLGVGVDAEEVRPDYEGATEYFTSFGISMAAASRLFYRKQVKKSGRPSPANQCSLSMLPPLSTGLGRHSHSSHWQRTRRPHRLFRATTTTVELSGHCLPMAPPQPPPLVRVPAAKQQLATPVADESLQLNITEILEQLTKFSETFSE